MMALRALGCAAEAIVAVGFAWLFWTEARVEQGRRDDDIAEKNRWRRRW